MIDTAQGPLSEGAFLIIGRVSFSDGRSIISGDCPEVYVAFLRGIDVSLTVYSGGWFAHRKGHRPVLRGRWCPQAPSHRPSAGGHPDHG